ncbi:MAG: SDR family oxidoreductase [Anaerolineae bacterium]
MELKGKVAVITGAGRGVGRSIALALASEGVQLALVARTESELKAVQQEVSALGVPSLVLPADISQTHQVESMATQTLQTFGTMDILINNAGWCTPLRPVLETTVEDWDRVMAVNARGTFLVTKAFLPALLAKGSGHIVNISTVVAKKGVAQVCAYCASKAAQVAFGESLLAEVGPLGIRVTNLLASPINTRMRWEATPDYPRERVLEPEDVAQVVLDVLKAPNHVLLDEVAVRKL